MKQLERITREYYKEIIDQTASLSRYKRYQALSVFFDSYVVHKKMYGSFKNYLGNEYIKKMSSRYEFMFERAMDYIRKEKENA